MRMCVKGFLVFGLAAALAGQVQAQGRGGFGGAGMLLAMESVKKDLKLTDDQAKKALVAVEKVVDKYKDQFAKLRELDEEDRRKAAGKLSKTATDESNKALQGILDAEQLKRLKQIMVQFQGVRALNNADVVSTLSLTNDQKEKIKSIGEESQQEVREIFGLAQGGDLEQAQTKLTAHRKETMGKVAAVLTPEQKKSWKDMIGEPFDLKLAELPFFKKS